MGRFENPKSENFELRIKSEMLIVVRVGLAKIDFFVRVVFGG
jgi:hypothetical protein